MAGLSELFTNIADAIRTKTGSSEPIVAMDFPETINNIPVTNLESELATQDELIDQIYEALDNISEGGGSTGGGSNVDLNVITATAPDVLLGKVIVDSNGSPVTGTMPNIGKVTETLSGNVTSSYTIPKGYHDGTGTVTVNAASSGGGVDVSGVTATQSDVLSSKKFVNSSGNLVSGTMSTITQATPSISVSSSGLITASCTQSSSGYLSSGTKSATSQLSTQSATTITPGISNKTAVASGKYTTGAVTVAGDANLVQANIRNGVTIFGVTGNYAGSTLGTATGSASPSNATSFSVTANFVKITAIYLIATPSSSGTSVIGLWNSGMSLTSGTSSSLSQLNSNGTWGSASVSRSGNTLNFSCNNPINSLRYIIVGEM